jgi:methylenetetrahydrofolate--tRNA-(uracil-5-)-methyltransferase
MNINFGLLPPLARKVKRPERKAALAKRALADLDHWLADHARAA